MIASTTIADAIRTVTAKVQNAIDKGERSRAIDADDLVEVLLAIADELEKHEPICCPDCGSTKHELLEDNDGGVLCECGLEYLIDV